jgi:hypothetical protein
VPAESIWGQGRYCDTVLRIQQRLNWSNVRDRRTTTRGRQVAAAGWRSGACGWRRDSNRPQAVAPERVPDGAKPGPRAMIAGVAVPGVVRAHQVLADDESLAEAALALLDFEQFLKAAVAESVPVPRQLPVDRRLNSYVHIGFPWFLMCRA